MLRDGAQLVMRQGWSMLLLGAGSLESEVVDLAVASEILELEQMDCKCRGSSSDRKEGDYLPGGL